MATNMQVLISTCDLVLADLEVAWHHAILRLAAQVCPERASAGKMRHGLILEDIGVEICLGCDLLQKGCPGMRTH